MQITTTCPAGKIGTTMENLQAAANGEHEEWTAMYPEFAKVARQEGFEAIAKVFEFISVAEKNHERRYRGFLDRLEKGQVFVRNETVIWYCRNCGYIHEGKEPPKACPACAHPQAYFQEL